MIQQFSPRFPEAIDSRVFDSIVFRRKLQARASVGGEGVSKVRTKVSDGRAEFRPMVQRI